MQIVDDLVAPATVDDNGGTGTMLNRSHATEHGVSATAHRLFAPRPDLVHAGGRRWFLQTGVAGMAGLSLADVLRVRANAAEQGRTSGRKSVILFWLSGGPSHIDMWDPKPDAPPEIRGPYGTISTRIPGVRFCEHLPLQASIADRLTVIRSVDCSASDHTPITMQAGNALARRTNDGKDGGGYPSMGSVAARFRGPNSPDMPAFIGLADSWKSDIWGAGNLGYAFEPLNGKGFLDLAKLPAGMSLPRLTDRAGLLQGFDHIRQTLDATASMNQLDRYQQMAFDMIASGKVQRAFDLSREPQTVRDAYGRVSVGEKALLARRLVEAGVTFVVVSGAWGYFDHHGDEVRWGGIAKGLTPILPTIDRAFYALILDLEQRGLLDSTLVLMLGEFGRTPVLTSTAGRGHWAKCMSMLVAGGALPTGQVIGATDRRGYEIVQDRVTPSDLAATVFRHLDIDLNASWTDQQGRPVPIVTEGGRPVPQLM